MQPVHRLDSYALSKPRTAVIRAGRSPMTRKSEKLISPTPVMSSSEYEAAVAAFIRNKGVTRCPTACVVPTQASVPATDQAALERYEARRERSRRENLAATARSLGILPPPWGEERPR